MHNEKRTKGPVGTAECKHPENTIDSIVAHRVPLSRVFVIIVVTDNSNRMTPRELTKTAKSHRIPVWAQWEEDHAHRTDLNVVLIDSAFSDVECLP